MSGHKPSLARYQEIECWLRERVLSGREGDPIPAETELAALFNVSRMTARQAVQNLATEGLVRRQRGSGTYIAPKALHRHSGSLMSFSSEMGRRGLSASSLLISAQLRAPLSSEVKALQLTPKSKVVSIVRLRLADQEPLSYERVALISDCASVLSADLEQGSLHSALVQIGRIPSTAITTISARNANSTESKILGIRAQSALLVETRTISDQHGRPLEFSESAFIASKYTIDVASS